MRYNTGSKLNFNQEKKLHASKVAQTKKLYEKIDNNPIPRENKEEILLFAKVRNESLRLPYFLNYYTHLGVDRFFILNNNSTDNTLDIVLKHPNTHTFNINENFKDSSYWMQYFLDTYGINKWCVVVDIDELLCYPSIEETSLKELIGYLESNKYTACRGLLLDLYSDKPIGKTVYDKTNPLIQIPYFDKEYKDIENPFFDKKNWTQFQFKVQYGGMRQRIFGKINGKEWRFCLSKVSLFKNSPTTYLTEGMHAINGANLADISTIVFHTKFFNDFVQYVLEEAEREQHYGDGIEYKIYRKILNENPNLNLKFNGSLKYQNSEQLTRLGLMKTSEKYIKYLKYLNF